jgi:hypothetical protein
MTLPVLLILVILQPADTWLALPAAAGRATIVVRTTTGDHIQGRLITLNASEVVIGDPPFRSVIPKSSVCRVTAGVQGRGARTALIATLTGAGYLVGKGLSGFTDDPRNTAGGLIGAGLGAIAGAAIPLNERLLYAMPGC